MRFRFVAATIVALSLIACSGPETPTPGVGPEDLLVETPGHAQPSTTAASPAPISNENPLIEMPEYTGVVISKNGTSEFSYLFDKASTEFWEPSVDDISRAEKCIRRFLESVQEDPKLSAFPKEDVALILNNLEQYRRQYVGIVVDGEQRIWCNSFFNDDSFPDWERVPVDVDGGGNRYWQIEYVLLQGKCTNFHVHGES